MNFRDHIFDLTRRASTVGRGSGTRSPTHEELAQIAAIDGPIAVEVRRSRTSPLDKQGTQVTAVNLPVAIEVLWTRRLTAFVRDAVVVIIRGDDHVRTIEHLIEGHQAASDPHLVDQTTDSLVPGAGFVHMGADRETVGIRVQPAVLESLEIHDAIQIQQTNAPVTSASPRQYLL